MKLRLVLLKPFLALLCGASELAVLHAVRKLSPYRRGQDRTYFRWQRAYCEKISCLGVLTGGKYVYLRSRVLFWDMFQWTWLSVLSKARGVERL